MSKTSPKLGVSYPLRNGKTLRNASRSLLSLKFQHVPNNTNLTAPGSLKRTHDKCTVSIPTHDDHAVVFSGTRSNTTAVAEYALVFANGAMWLERADDVYPGMRPSIMDGVTVPPPLPDDVRGDPDSWMVEESGSPVTPEGHEGEEDRGAGSRAGKSVAAKTVVATKGLPNSHMHNNLSSSDDDDDDDSDNNSDSDDSGSESSQEYTDRSSDED